MSTTDVVIKFIADTSGAQQNINQLVEAMGRASGTGTLGTVAAGGVVASMEFQDAMARIQTAYNSPDFAPGTAKFQQAHDTLVDMSTKLATPFSVLAETYGQGARFLDEFGNKLSTDKLDEYTESVTRLSKVSKDLDPTRAGQLVETLAKVYRSDDFKGITSASTALSGIHNMGEGPALEGAIAIGQYGAPLGVNMEQALGVANTLVDVGMSGQLGAGGMGAAGSSIGRQLLLMDQSADSILDPSASYKDLRAHREASERVDDLHESLEEAQAKQSEMFDSRGRLKREYLRHPSEKLAMDHRVAKLQREADDASQDFAHFDDLHTGGLDTAGRGRMNMRAMAATAGMDATQYAELFKENPMEALLDFTKGIGKLPAQDRGAAFRAAGIKNVRDLKVDELLGDRADVVTQNIATAGQQLANPTDLNTRSNIVLGTTRSKAQNVVDAGQAAIAGAGEPGRKVIDANLDQALKDVPAVISKLSDAMKKATTAVEDSGIPAALKNVATGIGLPDLPAKVKEVADGFKDLPPVVQAVLTAAGVTAVKAGPKALGPVGIGASVIEIGAKEAANWQKYQSGAENPGQFVGHAIEEMPIPGAAPIGGVIAGASGDARITVGGVNLHFYDVANGDLVKQAASQAAQQVYDGIMVAWANGRKTPSSQLGGAR